MKTISVIFNNKERLYVPETLTGNLKFIFEDFVEIRTYFTDDLSPGLSPEDLIEGDVFLVLYKDKVHPIRNYTKNLDKVIVISRTIQRRYFHRILEIPRGSSVLICNDSNESTLQTALKLYELGLNHINMIPYIPEETESLADIEYAITPNEAAFVPAEIPHVIDIGDRYLDTATIIRILNLLQLDNERITSNLIKYMGLVVEPTPNANSKYIHDFLKNEMIKKVVHNISDAILLTDSRYNLLYENDMAKTILESFLQYTDHKVEEIIGNTVFTNTVNENKKTGIVTLNSQNYQIEQFSITALDQTVGYCIAIKNTNLQPLTAVAKRGLVAKYHFEDIICRSRVMSDCIALSKKAALTDYTVLIDGESGTGKELLAQSIHNYSKRKDQPFVAINCAALPESLLESELFGYEKGAFTGAIKTGKPGLFEQADKGTIFLDEIGDMSLNLQSRLLRVLQEKQIMRLGSDKVINVDVRIIAATNRDVEKEIAEGNFRKDLFYRLNIIPVKPAPLKERREDVLLLMKHFMGRGFSALSGEEKEYLERYDWPGNIRELQNAAQYYQTIGRLPDQIGRNRAAQARIPAALSDGRVGSRGGVDSRGGIGDSDSFAAIPGLETREMVYSRILHLIGEHTGITSGIGRSALICECRQNGMTISDAGMRKILDTLCEKGLIETGRGRAGSRLTALGAGVLAEGAAYFDSRSPK